MASFLLVALLLCATCSVIQAAHHPVLFIPGDGGNRLYVKLNKTSSEHWYCEKNSDWSLFWLNYEAFVLPPDVDCFVDNMKLVYDKATHTTRCPEGIHFRTDSTGGLADLAYLDILHFVTYFGKIIDGLQDIGYKEGKDMMGMCYDWRKAPNELNAEMARIKEYIETLYKQNNNQRVYVVTHSMGGMMFLYFCQTYVDQAWKDQYVEGWIPIATPFLGSGKIIQLFASGYDIDVEILPSTKLRAGQRTWPSSAWLVPNYQYWGHQTQPMVKTPSKKYFVNQTGIKEFLDDLDFPPASLMWEDTQYLVDPMVPPNVTVHCLYGVGLDTPVQFVYDKDLPTDDKPTIINEDGDGSVNKHSGNACLAWNYSGTSYPVYGHPMQGLEHVKMLSDEGVVNIVAKLVTNGASSWQKYLVNEKFTRPMVRKGWQKTEFKAEINLSNSPINKPLILWHYFQRIFDLMKHRDF